ncbi:unnamed protein product [Linum trigynum]|uniref:Reverse transcriptase domain-containing protein n=1 Tax=Linum trigynum TaxID=586398 RepID=A0AAV2F1L2_9ROSI
MSLLCLNCQGLGDPKAVAVLGSTIRFQKPQIVFLSETKLKKSGWEKTMRELGFKYGNGVPVEGKSGGLCLFWQEGVNLEIKGTTKFFMDAVIKDDRGRDKWRFTGIYGWPEKENHHRTWDLLRELNDGRDLPWLCAGDFNQLCSNAEKEGGNLVSETRLMGFNNALMDCGLKDLGLVGYPFTWDNRKSGQDLIEERLDRAVANGKWMDLFQNAMVLHLEGVVSDHLPILIDPFGEKEEEIRWGKCFRFESFWAKDEESGEIIKEAWEEASWNTLDQSLKSCERKLKSWSETKFGEIPRRISQIRRSLQGMKLQKKNSTWRTRKRQLELELQDLLYKNEQRWKQRSRMEWLKEGEKNTKAFHAKASERRKKNTIKKLQDDQGRIHKGQEEVTGCLFQYYSKLFESRADQNCWKVIDAIEKKVTEEMNQKLLRPFTAEEIQAALFQMDATKAPGDDGFPSLFFQKNWSTIAPKVTEELTGFLNGGSLPTELNRTLIALIPKVKNPISPKEYRPISLCSILYKVLSKTITNRLKGVLNDLICEAQSAFVPGRSITDNVIAAFECFSTMKNKNKGDKGLLALKLDMAKVYDRVEWIFLERVMVKLGFDEKWIKLIMNCVSSVSYAVLVNGHKSNFFNPGRGLRQGDPLSPYLFLLCAEGLSALINKSGKEKKIHGLKICNRAPVVSHLLFADDCIIFARATVEESKKLKEVHEDYEKESGQMVNLDKSEIYFSKNTLNNRRQEICQVLKIKERDKLAKYLGLPTMVGRSKKSVFSNLRDRVRNKLMNWKNRYFSEAGKEILIKSIAQAQTTYAMSVFRIPDGILDDIHSLIANFWWGQKGNERRIHWKRWEKLCKKKNQGGIGFRNLKVFNTVILAKQLWNLNLNPQSLVARLLKAKYHPKSSILEAKVGWRPSYVWRSLMRAQDLLKTGCRWGIGTGEEVHIWRDRWIPGLDDYRVFSYSSFLDWDSKVSCLIDQETRTWRRDLIEIMFTQEEQQAILDIPLSPGLDRDSLCWTGTENGDYTVKSRYDMELNIIGEELAGSVDDQELNTGWNKLWKLNVPGKIKVFLWKVAHNIVPVGVKISKKSKRRGDECPNCGMKETLKHCLVNCSWVGRIWPKTPVASLFQMADGLSCKEWIFRVIKEAKEGEIERFSSLLWFFWKERNNCLFNSKMLHEWEVFTKADDFIQDYVAVQGKDNNRSGRADRRIHRWKKPPEGIYKLNSDAGCSGKGEVGMGFIIRDWNGKMILAGSRTVKAGWSPEIAEGMALKFGLEKAKDKGLRVIQVESDCQRLINILNGRENSRTEIESVCSSLISAGSEVNVVDWSFVYREANGVAHLLAHFFPFNVFRDKVWQDSAPGQIADVIAAEADF